MNFKCDIEKGGCDEIFSIILDTVRSDKYVQCPYCDRFIENPFYEEDGKTKANSYIN